MGLRDFSDVCLVTDRLTLRSWQEADASALFALRSSPEIMRYWNHGPYTDVRQAEQAVADFIKINREVRGLETAVCYEGEVIGTATLHSIVWESLRAELGYMLASENQGKGLMHEALVALVSYGFGEMGLNRLEADIDPRNLASRKSLERLGFQREGYMPERWVVLGEVTDTEFFGLLARDFLWG